MLSLVKPLFSAFSNFALIQSIWACCFLVAIDNEYGFLLSDDGKAISPVMVHDSFLLRVHYEEMHDRTGFDLIELYKNAIRMTRDDIIIDDMMFSYNK